MRKETVVLHGVATSEPQACTQILNAYGSERRAVEVQLRSLARHDSERIERMRENSSQQESQAADHAVYLTSFYISLLNFITDTISQTTRYSSGSNLLCSVWVLV